MLTVLYSMWGAAYAPNIGGLMVFRFLSGFCSCSTLNNVASSIGDYTTLEERGLHATVGKEPAASRCFRISR